MPKKRPTAVDRKSPTSTALKGTLEVKKIFTSLLIRREIKTPAAPPASAITLASITNCIMMSRRRAPKDFRMPISCVRSVTLASMMFMMTMPPTTMKTATIPMVTAKMDAVN